MSRGWSASFERARFDVRSVPMQSKAVVHLGVHNPRKIRSLTTPGWHRSTVPILCLLHPTTAVSNEKQLIVSRQNRLYSP
jgi:hypothetical protein